MSQASDAIHERRQNYEARASLRHYTAEAYGAIPNSKPVEQPKRVISHSLANLIFQPKKP